MKEFTTEQKAKAYDEALEIAKGLYANGAPDSLHLERMFPVLKENEDEKMLEELIDFLKEEEAKTDITSKRCRTLCKYIVWLEDQRNPHEAIKEEKVEPKFKVGDWVTDASKTLFHIINITHMYQLKTIEGRLYYFHKSYLERIFHLWTIKDAKDGDILHGINDNSCCIFKKIDDSDEDYFYAYCGIAFTGEFKPNPKNLWGVSNKHVPATKEQRDAFFTTMKKAGYIWDNATKRIL